MKTNFAVAQLGIRMHYAVPRIFQLQSRLEHMYTDFISPEIVTRVSGILPKHLTPSGLRRAFTRRPVGVPAERITAFRRLGIEYLLRRKRANTPSELTAAFLWAGKELCKRVVDGGVGSAGGVYTFNSAGLEILNFARSNHLRTVMEQTIAPAAIEDEILKAEEVEFPAWEALRGQNAHTAALRDREAQEWLASDVILCASEFVVDGIRKCGGPAERCRVVPYGFDADWSLQPREVSHKPIRVLVAGAVSLRKGSQYVLQAAKLLKGLAEFRMTGPLHVSPPAQAELCQVVNLVGAVPSADMREHYAWADVFLLPSLCEGSATVCYEALRAGLPVITTPNAGSIVRHSVDGYIVPARNSEAIAHNIELLSQDSALFARMSNAAVERSREYTVASYGRRLLDTIDNTLLEPQIGAVVGRPESTHSADDNPSDH